MLPWSRVHVAIHGPSLGLHGIRFKVHGYSKMSYFSIVMVLGDAEQSPPK